MNCTPQALRVGDNVMVKEAFETRMNKTQTGGAMKIPLQIGQRGRVVHRASDNGLTQIQFDGFAGPGIVMRKDLPKLQIILEEAEDKQFRVSDARQLQDSER